MAITSRLNTALHNAARDEFAALGKKSFTRFDNLRKKAHHQLDPPATCVLILSSHRHFKDTVPHNEVRVAGRKVRDETQRCFEAQRWRRSEWRRNRNQERSRITRKSNSGLKNVMRNRLRYGAPVVAMMSELFDWISQVIAAGIHWKQSIGTIGLRSSTRATLLCWCRTLQQEASVAISTNWSAVATIVPAQQISVNVRCHDRKEPQVRPQNVRAPRGERRSEPRERDDLRRLPVGEPRSQRRAVESVSLHRCVLTMGDRMRAAEDPPKRALAAQQPLGEKRLQGKRKVIPAERPQGQPEEQPKQILRHDHENCDFRFNDHFVLGKWTRDYMAWTLFGIGSGRSLGEFF